MVMSTRIEHRGTVESTDHNKVFVRVERKTACSECHAKGLCGEQGSERIMEVTTLEASSYAVGDKVIVSLESVKMGFSAILWAYLFPLCILLATLFTTHALGYDDGIAAISSLVATALYYGVLYVIRRYFDRKIKFTIIKE